MEKWKEGFGKRNKKVFVAFVLEFEKNWRALTEKKKERERNFKKNRWFNQEISRIRKGTCAI